jgi:PAS domain S-box-containing protein
VTRETPGAGELESVPEGDARYRALFGQCVEAVFLHDAETRTVLDANPAFLRLLGYTAAEARRLALYDVVAQTPASVDAMTDQTRDAGAVAIGRRLWRRKDGVLVDVDVSLGRFRQAGRDVVFAIARSLADAERPASLARRTPVRSYRAAGRSPRGAATGALSRREAQVLKLLALGYSNLQIAKRLKLSVKTVETFRARLSRKLDARGRPALVRHAFRLGLLTAADLASDHLDIALRRAT